MKRTFTTFAALILSAAFTIAADEAKKPDGAAPAPEAKKEGEAKKFDPEKAFANKDKDNDGNITKEEFTAGAKDPKRAEAAFAKLDTNSDGKLTKEEFAAHGEKRKKKE